MNRRAIERAGAHGDMRGAPRMQFVASVIGPPSMNAASCRPDKTAGRCRFALAAAVRTNRYPPFPGRDLPPGIRPEHVTNRRTRVQADFEDFRAGARTVEPSGTGARAFPDIGRGESVPGASRKAFPAESGRVLDRQAGLG